MKDHVAIPSDDAVSGAPIETAPGAMAGSLSSDQADVIGDVLSRVKDSFAPVWPLKDYVAVNPLGGLSGRRFLGGRQFLRMYTDCETLMPLGYYAEAVRGGRLGLADLEAALDELGSDAVVDVGGVSAQGLLDRLAGMPQDASIHQPTGERAGGVGNSIRRVQAISERVDARSGTSWSAIIGDEMSRHCAAHFDDGQAVWSSPWKDRSLYAAWLATCRYDRNAEVLGLVGFRDFVSSLSESPAEAIGKCLRAIGVPESHWELFLLCLANQTPGWSAWMRYQFDMAQRDQEKLGEPVEAADPSKADMAGLIAMRLAYETVLFKQASPEIDWRSMESVASDELPSEAVLGEAVLGDDDAVARYVCLRASELAYRRSLLGRISCPGSPPEATRSGGSDQKLAQMAFCIDVRSERFRRNLEAAGDDVETIGFAGFFGLPIEYVPIGQSSGDGQVPVLLPAQFQVHEGIRGGDAGQVDQSVSDRRSIRSLRKAWKSFQASAVGCFAFVETAGWLYGYQMLRRSVGKAVRDRLPGGKAAYRFDGVSPAEHASLGPTLGSLDGQGITATARTDMAQAVLKGLGLTKDFGRLVVFCGHGSETDNNPLRAGLDCGACGGHTGESNARFAATLLNHSDVRQGLADRGMEVPEQTHFVAALHNTTTDEIEFFDVAELPDSGRADVDRLAGLVAGATGRTLEQRMPIVDSASLGELLGRSGDWSEVRPEWGLAGNAAFIVGPRSMTRGEDFDGRTFLHNYDHHADDDGSWLEQIMTAPMVVAHLINMQYYASTVDNRHFGSGTKTVHNVVGRFGLFSGNSGDLMTGLPWQSLHTGTRYQHEPMRLLVLIAAPRPMIDAVIAKHAGVADSLHGGWLQLVALEDGRFQRRTEHGTWIEIPVLSATTSAS